jgi:phospholipid/cholesterol/gamma-HCH transport system ATP-binding protein
VDRESDAVRLVGVTKRFGGTIVLDRLDLNVRRGENLAILGQSGSGKSVLLKLIIGLLRPDEGEVVLWGQPTSSLDEEDLAPLRRRMGFVFQSSALFDSISVFDNLAFPLREYRTASEDRIRKVVEERLRWVGLDGLGDKQPAELSGGMRKRVALARTLSVDPELILYDEPTTGLDPETGRKVATLIRDLDNRLHSTTIVVTHDIDCAQLVADRWAFLARGRIVAEGKPGEVRGSEVAEVRAFIDSWRTEKS